MESSRSHSSDEIRWFTFVVEVLCDSRMMLLQSEKLVKEIIS